MIVLHCGMLGHFRKLRTVPLTKEIHKVFLFILGGDFQLVLDYTIGYSMGKCLEATKTAGDP